MGTRISRAYLERVYRKPPLNVLYALQVFKAMDQNADGFISREEFVKAFEPNLELPRHPTADDLIAAARRKKTAETVSPAANCLLTVMHITACADLSDCLFVLPGAQPRKIYASGRQGRVPGARSLRLLRLLLVSQDFESCGPKLERKMTCARLTGVGVVCATARASGEGQDDGLAAQDDRQKSVKRPRLPHCSAVQRQRAWKAGLADSTSLRICPSEPSAGAGL